MKDPKITCLINMPRQIPFAKILHKTCPVKLKIVVSNFSATSEFTQLLQLRKTKRISSCLNSENIEDLKDHFGEDLAVCNSIAEFDNAISSSDICLSDGREFYIFIPKFNIKKYVALSTAYVYRLMQVLPIYNGKLFICAGSKSQLEFNIKEMRGWNNAVTEPILNNLKKVFSNLSESKSLSEIDLNPFFYESGFMQENYNILEKQGKEKVREELGLPLDRKIALFSCRKGTPQTTLFSSDQELVSQNENALKKLKDMGYYIVCRERNGNNDRGSHQQNVMSDICSSELIDKRMSSFKGFPSEVYKLCYASDLIWLADLSALGSIEGLICQKPCYVPYIKELSNEFLDGLSFAFKDCIESGHWFNDLTEKNISLSEEKAISLKNKHYNANIENFWKDVLS
jgi:hypothetical protein